MMTSQPGRMQGRDVRTVCDAPPVSAACGLTPQSAGDHDDDRAGLGQPDRDRGRQHQAHRPELRLVGPRLTGVWLPGRLKASQSASMQFSYTIPPDADAAVTGPVVVTTRELCNDGQCNVSYQLHDRCCGCGRRSSPRRVVGA